MNKELAYIKQGIYNLKCWDAYQYVIRKWLRPKGSKI
jgi:hypothetical protein